MRKFAAKNVKFYGYIANVARLLGGLLKKTDTFIFKWVLP
jgi:hypothetical protein